MGFTEAVKSCFSNYANFKGRAVRSEFWYFYLFSIIVNGIATFVDMSNGYDTPELGSIEILVMLFLLIPNIAVTTRRLHDTDHSGWWQLLVVIPIIGWIILIVWWCTKGTTEANRFGETRYNSDDNINGQVKSAKRINTDLNDNNNYILAYREVEIMEIENEALWVKAYAMSEGNEEKQKSIYVKLRAEELDENY